MRLMREHAEVEQKLISGALSLSVATQLQTAFRNADLPLEKKREVIASVEGKTAREAERTLVEISPLVSPPKRELRPINSSESVLKLVVDRELLEKMERLRALFSHRKPGMTFRDLLEILINQALRSRKHSANCVGEAVRYISPGLKTKIRERDGFRCTYVDPHTSRRCEEKQLLEFDHIVPVALGGKASFQNLRLLCRTHNRLAAEDAGLTFSPQTNPSSGKPAAH